MTVNTTNITSGPYSGNDIADTFSYTFRISDKSQLKIYETNDQGFETLLTVDTDYVVNSVGDDNGGTITRVAGALPTGYIWFIRADYEATQNTAFQSQGAFFPDLHEDAADKLTFLIQQILDKQGRSPSLPDSYIGTLPITLPTPSAGKVLVWNDFGSGFNNATVGASDVLNNIKQDNIGDYAAIVFDSVDELVSASMSKLDPSSIDSFGKVAIKTLEYHAGTGYGGWNASSFAISLADYRTEIGNPTWTPNGYNERYLYGGTEYVAMYKSCSVCDVLKYGHKRDNSLNGTALYVAMMDNRVKRILFPQGDYKGNINFAGRQGIIVEGVGQSNDRFDQNGAVRLLPVSEGDDVITFGGGASQNSIACGVEHVCIDSRYDKTYSHLGRGIYVNVFSPSVVWRCYVRHVFIRGFNRNFEINCDINASECFNCDFHDIESIGSNEHGHKVRGVYNTYYKMFATQCEDFAFFNDGSNCNFDSIIGDGRMAFKGGGQHITNAVIEAIHTNTPNVTLPAFEVNGNTSTARGIRLNGVPKTIYNLGISVFGANHTLENIVIQGANSPEESVRLNGGSSGVLKQVDAALTSIYIDDIASDATIQDWEFAGSVSDVLRSESFSWTPVLDRLTTSPSLSYSLQIGSYVKRRNIVTCFARLTIASVTSQGSGQWFISGLPFAAKAGSLRYSAIVGQSEIFEASAGYTGAGTSTILLTRLGALISGNAAPGTIAIEISYEVE